MTTRSGESLPLSFFDEVYAADPDPWSFATSEYENTKYAVTLAELPQQRYHSAFEIGCSIGVLSEQLAVRCDALLSVDVAERALQQARERCAHLSQATFRLLQVPREFPDQQFDLVVVSEVGYYWSLADLRRARDLIIDHLVSGGQLMLVHFTVEVENYPISGDAVHEAFIARARRAGNTGTEAPLRHLRGRREQRYRLDLFERR
jgi:predicted TPR repeat methyltransferase